MRKHGAPQCCGRPMSSIGVERSGVLLHSCPSCGRHSWMRDGVEVDRDALLDALRVTRPVRAARVPRPVPVAPAGGGLPEVDEAARRAELQRLLGGFTVHGSTS